MTITKKNVEARSLVNVLRIQDRGASPSVVVAIGKEASSARNLGGMPIDVASTTGPSGGETVTIV